MENRVTAPSKLAVGSAVAVASPTSKVRLSSRASAASLRAISIMAPVASIPCTDPAHAARRRLTTPGPHAASNHRSPLPALERWTRVSRSSAALATALALNEGAWLVNARTISCTCGCSMPGTLPSAPHGRCDSDGAAAGEDREAAVGEVHRDVLKAGGAKQFEVRRHGGAAVVRHAIDGGGPLLARGAEGAGLAFVPTPEQSVQHRRVAEHLFCVDERAAGT